MKYRSDIDGLRAVAVLPIIAFHFGYGPVPYLPISPGGFVGVDVFLVISGYLITKVLAGEVQDGTYSLSTFYARRIKRIFPALMVVYVACLIGALILFIPSETKHLGQAMLASVFFVSNLFFANQSSYFDVATRSNPLLHTWSLSVEEQFYIFFPLLLFLIRKQSAKVRLGIVAACSVLSFAYSVYLVEARPTEGFYSVGSRAWELAVGSLLALWSPTVKNRWIAEGLSAVGLLAIGYCVLFYTDHMPFPGVLALVPCLAAAAIIYAGSYSDPKGGALVSRFLSLPPMRFTGKISYSLYLWHWPVIVFYRSVKLPGKLEVLGLIGLCFVIAYLSWRYIEQPFRKPLPKATEDDAGGARWTVIRHGLVAMAVVAVLALGTMPLSRMIWPSTPETERLSQYLDYNATADASMRIGTCFLSSGYNSFSYYKKDDCLKVVPGRKTVLIFGDSHSAHLYPGFVKAYPDINFIQASSSGCVPTFPTKGEGRCEDLVRYINTVFLPKNHIDAVILSGQWFPKDVKAAIDSAARLTPYADKVYLFGPNPEYEGSLPRLLLREIMTRQQGMANSHLIEREKVTDDLFAQAKMPAGVEYVSTYGALCAPVCQTTTPDKAPVMFDSGHLTVEGSTLLAQLVGKRLFASAHKPAPALGGKP